MVGPLSSRFYFALPPRFQIFRPLGWFPDTPAKKSTGDLIMTLVTLYGSANSLLTIVFVAPYRKHTWEGMKAVGRRLVPAVLLRRAGVSVVAEASPDKQISCSLGGDLTRDEEPVGDGQPNRGRSAIDDGESPVGHSLSSHGKGSRAHGDS